MTWFVAARAFLSRIPWQLYAALALAAAWYIERDNYGDRREYEGRAAIIAKYERETRKQAEQLEAEAVRYEALREQLRLAERTDRETIREIYRDKIAPAECAADPRAVSVLSEAVDRANAAASGEPVGTLP